MFRFIKRMLQPTYDYHIIGGYCGKLGCVTAYLDISLPFTPDVEMCVDTEEEVGCGYYLRMESKDEYWKIWNVKKRRFEISTKDAGDIKDFEEYTSINQVAQWYTDRGWFVDDVDGV